MEIPVASSGQNNHYNQKQTIHQRERHTTLLGELMSNPKILQPDTKFKMDEFCTRITCHGIIDWYEASTLLSKWFWAAAFVASTAVLVYTVYECFYEFYTNPVITTIRAIPVSSLPFPAVYICPTNFVNRSKLISDPKARSVLGIFTAASTAAKGILGYRNRTADSLMPRDVASTKPNQTVENVTPALTLLSRQEQIFNVSMNITEFVKECAFQNKYMDCLPLVKRVLDKDYGVCYQIETKEHQSVPGSGLSLVLDIHSENLPLKMALTDGATVIVRDASQIVSGRGVLVSPGTLTQILLRQRSEHLITVSAFSETPQICNNDGDIEFKALNVSYTKESCQFDCLQQKLLQKCGCLLPIDVTYLRKEHHSMERFCTKDNYTQCLLPAVEKNRSDDMPDCYKGCHKACKSIHYGTSNSFQKIPSMALQELSDAPPHPLGGVELNQFREDLLVQHDIKRWQNNYIILDIAFSELEILSMEQNRAMTANTLIANLGGQFGLWLGASLFTILQFAVFAVKLCATKLKRKNTDLKRSNAVKGTVL